MPPRRPRPVRTLSLQTLLSACLLLLAAGTAHGEQVEVQLDLATLREPGPEPPPAPAPGEPQLEANAAGWVPVLLVVPQGHAAVSARAWLVEAAGRTGAALAAEVQGTTGYLGYEVALVRVQRPTTEAMQRLARPALRVEVETQPGAALPVRRLRDDAEQRQRTLALLRQQVANPELLEAYAPAVPARRLPRAGSAAAPRGFHPSVDPSLEGSGVRYLIVTTQDLAPVFQPLADWKTKRGMPAQIRTIEWIEGRTRHGVDRAETLRNFLIEAYALWGVQYVLLGGDTGILTARFLWSSFLGSSTTPSDLYFAGLDGSWNEDGDALWGEASFTPGSGEGDLLPELDVARAPVNDAEQAQQFVSRVIRYETPYHADYQSNALFLSEVLIPANWDSGMTISYDGAAASELMISESLPPGFGTQRHYDTYWLHPGSTKLRKSSAIAAMNSGPGIVNQLGHGFRYTMSAGDASIVNADADALTNGGRTFVLLMANCAAASFDYDCLAEHFLLNPGGGAAGVIGAARSVSAFQIVAYNRAFFRQLFLYDKIRLAEVLNALRLERVGYAEIDGGERWIQFTLNALGDPEMTIFTGSVRTADVVHAPALAVSPDTLQVQVSAGGLPVAGARVCALKSDEVYASGSTDSTGQIFLAVAPESPGSLFLTVSGQNLATKTDTLQVLPAGVPVLRFAAMQVDDDSTGASSGNGDASLDAGETVELGIQVGNQGGADASDVTGTVQSLDARLTVLLDSLAVGAVPVGQTGQAAAPVVVHISPLVPDGTVLELELHLQDAEARSWTDRVRLLVGAPRLEVTHVSILPPDTLAMQALRAGPRRISNLLPTARLVVEVKNYGSGAQPHLVGRLTSSAPAFVVLQDSTDFAGIAPLAQLEGAPAFEIADTTAAAEVLTLWLHDAYGRSFSQRVDLQPPPPPTTPVADLTVGAGTVRLTWTPSAVPDRLGYHVFRRIMPAGVFARLTPDIIHPADFYDTTVQSNSSYEYYTVTVDSSRQWSAPSSVMTVNTTAALLTGYPIDMTDPTASSVAVGDLDGDGRPEIVAGDKGVYAWQANGIEVLDGDSNPTTYGVFSSAPGVLNSSVALAQIDGQIGLEIVAASWLTNRIYVWKGDGQLLPGWPREPANGGNTGYWASPVVADLDGDGSPEILAVSKDGWLYTWHADGTPLLSGTNGAVRNVGAWTQTTPAVADLDGDGHLEIIAAGATAFLYVIRSTDGSDFPGWPVNLYTMSKCSPAIGDVDVDGHLEIVLSTDDDKIHVLRTDGTEMPGWPLTNVAMDAPDFGPSVALGDLNGDGRLEIVIVAVRNPWELSKLYVYDADRNILLVKQLEYNSQASPILADLDGDGSVDIAHGNEAGILHAWSLSGAELRGFPIPLGDFVRSTPAYCDLDMDGKGDLVYAGWDHKLYAWRMLGAYRRDRAPWPTFHGDMQRTGLARPSFPAGVAEPARVPARLSATWSPNPFNPTALLRFTIPGAAPGGVPAAVPVRVDLFDARGRLVRTLVNDTRPPGAYLVAWDGRDARGRGLGSGVFLYRVRAGAQAVSGKLTLVR